ncbi:MAG TPA: hypothetical protein PK587_07355 [Syntrophales bacterium]|nr:hypothetical protein [Syntrophales bacterium]
MKRRSFVVAAVVILAATLLLYPSVFAQSSRTAGTPYEGQNWAIGTPLLTEGGPALPESPGIVTINGTVLRTEPMKGVRDGLQMRVKTQQGQIWLVYLGPRWFVENQRIKFQPNDVVEVRGAKVLDQHGRIPIIASEVSKGDLSMILRNESNGLPSWECCVPRKARPQQDQY